MMDSIQVPLKLLCMFEVQLHDEYPSTTQVYMSRHSPSQAAKICHSTVALESSLRHAVCPSTVGRCLPSENLVNTLFTRSTTSSSPNLSAIVSQYVAYYIVRKTNSRILRHITTLPVSTPNLDTTSPQPSELHPRRPIASKSAGHPEPIWVACHSVRQALAVLSHRTVVVDCNECAVSTEVLGRAGGVNEILVANSDSARKSVVNTDVVLEGVGYGSGEDEEEWQVGER